MNHKNLTLLTLLLLVLVAPSVAQYAPSTPVSVDIARTHGLSTPKDTEDGYDKNILKLNVPAIILKNFSLQYERLISRKISAAISFRYMPNGKFPMLNSFESLIDDAATFDQLQRVSVGNIAFTPEVRFYFGKHDGARGFYIAPYARFSNYQVDFNEFEYTVEYENEGLWYEETKSAPLNGNLNGFTGGVLFGAQWNLGRWVYLDWWILGPAYGVSKGKLSTLTSLSTEEQQGLRDALESLDIPLVKSKTHVDANGARMDIDGPWAGVRAGLALGVKF